MDSLDTKEFKETSFNELLRVSNSYCFSHLNNNIIPTYQGNSIGKCSSKDSLDSKEGKTTTCRETLRVSASKGKYLQDRVSTVSNICMQLLCIGEQQYDKSL